MDITAGEWTVKIRDAGPGEPEPGEAEPGLWTGILPITSGYEPRRPPRTARRYPGLPFSPQGRGH